MHIEKTNNTNEISPNYINLINSKDKKGLEKELNSVENIIKLNIDLGNSKIINELKAKKELIKKQINKLNTKKFGIHNIKKQILSILKLKK